jgi:hypothetical protein
MAKSIKKDVLLSKNSNCLQTGCATIFYAHKRGKQEITRARNKPELKDIECFCLNGTQPKQKETWIYTISLLMKQAPLFKDALSLTIYDPLHSEQEDRFILVGNSIMNRLLLWSTQKEPIE